MLGFILGNLNGESRDNSAVWEVGRLDEERGRWGKQYTAVQCNDGLKIIKDKR